MDLRTFYVTDYCTSEHFLFLNASSKEYAESMLTFWCEQIEGGLSRHNLETSLNQMAQLDVPLSIRKTFPDMLKAFMTYLAESGSLPDALRWIEPIEQLETAYVSSFRDDGSIKGKTFQKSSTASAGRNAPCPCGSGKKYKKCCMQYFE